MPTNYPTSLDNFTNPTANDSLNLPSHSTQHANANDAIEAIEAKLGIGNADKVGVYLVNATSFTSQSSIVLQNLFTSTYSDYYAEIDFVHTTGGMVTYLQYYSGATLLTGATDYRWQETYFSTTTVPSRSTGDAFSQILSNVGATNAALTLRFYNPQVSGITTNSSHQLTAGALTAVGSGAYVPTTSVDGFRFVFSAGLATGTINVYGLRKSTA